MWLIFNYSSGLELICCAGKKRRPCLSSQVPFSISAASETPATESFMLPKTPFLVSLDAEMKSEIFQSRNGVCLFYFQH